jgi:hypothetical protein
MNTIRDILNKHLFQGIFIGMLAILLLRTTGANAALALSCGQWNIAKSPGTSADFIRLDGVATLSATNVWAVGYVSKNISAPSQTLIEHWNGKQWNVVSSPNIPSADHFLDAVAASSANNVWTVGDYFSHTDNLYHTLTEFYC